jgi:hypothetical protein
VVDVGLHARTGQERPGVVRVANGQATDGHPGFGELPQRGHGIRKRWGLGETFQHVGDLVVRHRLLGLGAQRLAGGRGEVRNVPSQCQRHGITLEPHEERPQHRRGLPDLLEPGPNRLEVKQSLQDVESNGVDSTSHAGLLPTPPTLGEPTSIRCVL